MIYCDKRLWKDEWCHFGAGFIITIIASFFVGSFIGVGVAVMAGIAKEAYDQYKYQGADFLDFFTTVLGGISGMLIFEILSKIFNWISF